MTRDEWLMPPNPPDEPVPEKELCTFCGLEEITDNDNLCDYCRAVGRGDKRINEND